MTELALTAAVLVAVLVLVLVPHHFGRILRLSLVSMIMYTKYYLVTSVMIT